MCAGSEETGGQYAPKPATKYADLQVVYGRATGLEPATSGVTGRANDATIYQHATRKSPNSKEFCLTMSIRLHELEWGCPVVLPRARLIVLSAIETTGGRLPSRPVGVSLLREQGCLDSAGDLRELR
jgi:hypothetical protein